MIRALPVAKLNAKQLKDYILEVLECIIRCKGNHVSLTCDNCPLNKSAYYNLDDPGPIKVAEVENPVFLVYDHVNIFKDVEVIFTLISSMSWRRQWFKCSINC